MLPSKQGGLSENILQNLQNKLPPQTYFVSTWNIKSLQLQVERNNSFPNSARPRRLRPRQPQPDRRLERDVGARLPLHQDQARPHEDEEAPKGQQAPRVGLRHQQGQPGHLKPAQHPQGLQDPGGGVGSAGGVAAQP